LGKEKKINESYTRVSPSPRPSPSRERVKELFLFKQFIELRKGPVFRRHLRRLSIGSKRKVIAEIGPIFFQDPIRIRLVALVVSRRVIIDTIQAAMGLGIAEGANIAASHPIGETHLVATVMTEERHILFINT
jgi:hypothetical protein